MSMKKVVILKGSPREKGNSALLAEQAAAGARAAGAQVDIFYLHGMDIRACDGCDLCHEQGDGCVIMDDMQLIYPKLKAADAILVASPVYWFTLSAQTKLCIDRWYALESPQGNELAGKKMGLLLTFGDTDPFSSGGINAIRTFQDMCRYLGTEVAGMVYGSASDAGEIQDQPLLLEGAYKLGEKIGGEYETAYGN